MYGMILLAAFCCPAIVYWWLVCLVNILIMHVAYRLQDGPAVCPQLQNESESAAHALSKCEPGIPFNIQNILLWVQKRFLKLY